MGRDGPAEGLAGASVHGVFGSLKATLGAGSVVQALSALAGFAVLPILVQGLGSAAFGALVVVVSLGPWLMILDGALYPATRLLVGEMRGGSKFRAPTSLLGSARSMAFRIMGLNAAIVVASLVALPIAEILGLESVMGPAELALAVAVFAAPIIASGPGGLYLGALEGVGRTVVAAVLAGIGPIVALPLTVLVSRSGGGFVALCGIQGMALALPRFAAWAYWFWKPSTVKDAAAGPNTVIRVALVVQLAALAALALAQTGLAPVIVSSHLGAEAVASYGMAWRIVAGSLLPLGIMTPLFAASIAAARGGGWTDRSESDLRRLILWSLGAGLICGALVVLLGPPVTGFLSGGDVEAPASLYVAGGAYVVCLYVSQPFNLAFSGPRGIRTAVGLNVLLTLVTIFLSVMLVDVLGPAGPLWAAAAATAGAVLFWLGIWRTRPHFLREVHSLGRQVD